MRTNSVIINGGNPLKGVVSVQGSKNETLPILAASILFKEDVTLYNVPDLSDIHALLEILEYLGATYTFEDGVVRLDCRNLQNRRIPDEFSNRLRASSLIFGPLLARFGECEVGMPGGCVIGNRPLDIHFKGFKALGADVLLEGGMVRAQSDNIAGEFILDFPSVGATQNLISCAAYSSDRVVLKNIAKEPEIINMIEFLNRGGAKISFDDSGSLVIEGVKDLKSVDYTIQADRIEAGTFLFAALATKGEVTLKGANPDDLGIVLHTLSEMGAKIETEKNSIKLSYDGRITGTKVKTAVYPGFPTDLQSQLAVLMSQAETPSVLIENIFNSRFRYVDELLKMNANIKIDANDAYIDPSELSGCRVESYDLRGAASMIMAGLCAEGVTRVTDLQYLYRGYEAFVEKLQVLGADISYI